MVTIIINICMLNFVFCLLGENHEIMHAWSFQVLLFNTETLPWVNDSEIPPFDLTSLTMKSGVMWSERSVWWSTELGRKYLTSTFSKSNTHSVFFTVPCSIHAQTVFHTATTSLPPLPTDWRDVPTGSVRGCRLTGAVVYQLCCSTGPIVHYHGQ